VADQFPPPQRAGAGNLLLAPAIALLVVGIPGVLGSAASIALAAFGEFGGPASGTILDPLASGTRGLGDKFGVVVLIALHGFLLLVSSLGVAGALAMLRGRPLALGWAGAVGVMLNPTCCCCIPGIGVGIWTMIALARHQAEAAQSSGGGATLP
jgi:hypothetical protein